MKRSFTSREKKQIVLLTAAVVACFFGVRYLPAMTSDAPFYWKAAFSREVQPEFCELENAGFVLVSRERSAMTVDLELPKEVVPGREIDVVLTLRTTAGRLIEDRDIQESHTEKIHLLLVDPSLDDYQHHHPEPLSKPGRYRFRFTPRKSGTYRLFAELMPRSSRLMTQGVAEISVVGNPSSPAADLSGTQHVAHLVFEMEPEVPPLRSNRASVIRLRARDRETGEMVMLEPVMGAFAHLVGFDEERRGFAHMHPLKERTPEPGERVPADLAFRFLVRDPGYYRVWTQVKIDGREWFVPFGFEVL